MNSQKTLLFSLFRIGLSIHHFNKRSEEKFGLSLVQWCLLEQLVDMPGTSAYALAKSVGIHPSTLTQTLRRLEKKGFLYQAEDPKDSRKKIISLTKSGRQALDRTSLQMREWSNALAPIGGEIRIIHSTLQAQIGENRERDEQV